MSKAEKYHNDFVVDRLTNSITNSISGDSFATEISLLSRNELPLLTKKNGWVFNWRQELALPDREVYKLTIVNNPTIIQGVISLTIKSDHVFIYLIENAPFNKGKGKLYEGVAGNMAAFACRLSFQRGCDGFVSFYAKTNLIDHYIKTLEAKHFGYNVIVIDNEAALKLVDKYFKG